MREGRDPTGKMPHRIWYTEDEIDTIMEDELRKAGRRHSDRGTAVDVDFFVEQHLKITPTYVKLPPGVQGATDFTPMGKVTMRICADISERAGVKEPGAENFVRTTIAHEAAHVLLHRTLFLKQSEAMFGRKVLEWSLCRDVNPISGYSGEWWEWQANRGMGALLLPRREMRSYLHSHQSLGDSDDQSVVREVAERYQVSTQVVKYRFEQLSEPDKKSSANSEF